MLSIGIHQQPCYTVLPTLLGSDFEVLGHLWWCEYMSWLRLTGFPHPYQTYTKCVSTLISLICCPMAYSSSLLTQLIPFLVGSDFGVLGHLWSQNDVITPRLRLTATSNCFPHPYCTYTKCLSTLICCPYAYSSSLTQFNPHYLAPNLGQGRSLWCQNLGCAFRWNSGGFRRNSDPRHQHVPFRPGTGTGMCYNTNLDIPVYSGWYLSTWFLQVENARNYSK